MSQHEQGFDPTLGSLPPAPEIVALTPPVPPSSGHMQVGQRQATLASPPPPTGCRTCAATPTDTFTFREVAGGFFTWKMKTTEGTFCGPCAQSLGRAAQSRTATTGWFGFLAAVINLGVIPMNAVGLRRAAALPANPNSSSLDPGSSFFKRPGAFVMLAVFGLLGFVAVSAATDSTKTIDRMNVGECFADPGLGEITTVEELACDEPHELEVFHRGTLMGFSSFPAEDVMFDVTDAGCIEAFAGYVGTSYENSSFYFSVISPTSLSWRQGDRDYICLLTPASGSTVGSARDSGR